MADPLPLNRVQLTSLARAAAIQLSTGLRAVSDEVRRWRRHAAAIPDPLLRVDALSSLDNKRGHTDGAAMFWTLPARRDRRLLRALVAYEILQDYLDGVSERGAAADAGSGAQLYRALGDALDPDRPVADYYRDHPWRADGGYLRGLVDSVRADSGQLPSFAAIRPALEIEIARTAVLHRNHIVDPLARDQALEAWALAEFPEGSCDLRWYELTAASSGWITTHALLALSADAGVTDRDVTATVNAYWPWYAVGLTMIDSFVDQVADAEDGDHSYFAHYSDPREGVLRLALFLERSAGAVLQLPGGERHAVLLGCMIALYLSKDSARSASLEAATVTLVRASGSLPRLLLPVLRTWRVCNSQASHT
jgi:tetraprenyl-beta-curcumene synthase